MFSRSSSRFAVIVSMLLCLASATTQAAPSEIRVFNKTSWPQLKQNLPRPGVVVFTTTDCAYCPAVIEALSTSLKKGGRKANLVVVVMDGAGQPEAVRADPHYRKADSLYVFEGQATALRFGVNPDWRGMTPYVALFRDKGEPKFVIGGPSAAEVADLLRP